MPSPLALPIRVLVKGASTVGVASPMGGPRTDFTFPRGIESALCDAGRPAEVRAITVASEQVKTALRRWEREALGYSPDVVVLVYGHYETVHLFLPHWLERHANSERARPGRWSDLYRRHVLRPVWMLLAKTQAKLDRVVSGRPSRIRRVIADYEALIAHLRWVHSPLVFVFELQPPAARYRSWFPGMATRIAQLNRETRAMVERIGEPDVRFFETTDVVADLPGGIDAATPDGFHFTPELHRMIGTKLATEILAWAETQDHLKTP